ncbi:MAG: flagellar filament capping protein FliD [Pirellulaceae bacterium]
MFSIDGLVSGLDTSAIIEGLLSIQQSQLDRMELQKQQIVVRQSAFQGIEANVVALQSAARQLSSHTNDVFSVFSAASSDESVLQVAADGKAAAGTWQVQVTQLAQAAQVSSQALSGPEALLTQGTVDIQVGNGDLVSIEITQDNNTLQGLVDSINGASSDVTATIVNDGTGSRLLLTSRHTGAENQITINNQTGPTSGNETQIDFSGPAVQQAADAIVTLGSGAGAINITKATNTIDDVIQGMTLNLVSANPDTPITISVERDTESARSAIEGFVASFNTVMSYIDDQTSYNTETDEAGLLIGSSSVNTIRDQLRSALNNSIPNLESGINRLSSIGITFNDRGQLQINSGTLDSALSGQLEGVDPDRIRQLFALDAQSTSAQVSFVSGTQDTASSENPWDVVITKAAERATITATNTIASSTVIDGSNDSFSIEVDGLDSGTLTLGHGTYTQTELADHLQSVINQSSTLGAREVSVTVENKAVVIESVVFGTRSEVGSASGTAATALGFVGSVSGTAAKAFGFVGNEYSRGKDVAGYFVVEGETETATGNGRILSGDADNANSAGLQLRVTLNPSQIAGTFESELTVSRGYSARLEGIIDNLLDPENGRFHTGTDAYQQQIDSIDQSVDRMNSLFETKQQQLISQFVAIESSLSSLQNTSAFLASQLGGLTLLG